MVAKALSEVQRRSLLEGFTRMKGDSDIAPDEIARVFLPLPEHKRVLDDRVVLVLGERGVGKSALFHFLNTSDGARLLGERDPSSAARQLVIGFSEIGREHPAPASLEQLEAEDQVRAFWLGHLVGRISASLAKGPPFPAFVDSWRAHPAAPATWLPAVGDPTAHLLWLDRLEADLESNKRSIIVTYDHLDRIGIRSRDVRRRVLPPLLALWLSFSNRYRKLRAKIFLRRDLFDESVTNTSDASKLMTRSETLRWTVPSLFRLLVRHMAASSDELRQWLEKGTRRIPLTEDALLGWMPPDDLPETGKVSQEALMAHIVGPRMGSGRDPRSGYSYKWVPNHLRDAHAVIAPRSIIRLFQSAAQHALGTSPAGQYMRLLAPEELKQGLRDTSSMRVSEIREEHPVIERLGRLKELSLPLEAKDAATALAHRPDTTNDDFGSAGDRVLEELVRLGVIEELPKFRVDIPDIYRLHFNINRRGQKVVPKV